MSFQSLPMSIRQLRATEALLERVYNAAQLGLKGDNLALTAGLQPIEYRRLCQMDPLVELAEAKGRADAEAKLSGVLHDAAYAGDAKAALALLQNRHDWVQKQSIQIDVAQRISISAALEEAQSRVLDGLTREVPSAEASLLSRRRAVADGAAMESEDRGRPGSVRAVRVPLEPTEHPAG